MKHSRLFVFSFCCVIGAADVRAHDTASNSDVIVGKCTPEQLQKVWMSIDADTLGSPAGTPFALSMADEPKTIDGKDYGDWTLFSPVSDINRLPLSLHGTCIDMRHGSGPKMKEYVVFAGLPVPGASDTKIRLFAILAHREHMNDVKCDDGHKKMQSCKAALRSNVRNFIKVFDFEIDLASTEITPQAAEKPVFLISELGKQDIGAGHAHGTD
jgi:hypothetical protein